MTRLEESAKLTVGEVSVDLSAEDVRSIVSNLEDNDAYTDLFAVFARSTSYLIRSEVARKDNLSKESVELLSRDSVVEVLRQLIKSSAARSQLDDEQLAGFVAKDAELAFEIAGDVERFEGANSLKLAELLSRHPDPAVRRRLAENGSTPKAALRALSKDDDPGVAAAARNSMR